MAEDILNRVEEMDQEEFDEFSNYLNRVSGSFTSANYDVVEDVRENVQELYEAGGNPVALGRLWAIRRDVESPETYVAEIRDYRASSDFPGEVDNTIREVFSGFFEEEKSEYLLE